LKKHIIMQRKSELPIVGITMGDPSGISPEIILKALSDREIYKICIPLVIGDKSILSIVKERILRDIPIKIRKIERPEQAEGKEGILELISLSNLQRYTPGQPYIEAGKAMVSYIEYAVRLALENRIDAIVTCPINKYLMHKAGFNYDGHTPLIADLTNTKEYVMMLAGERLKVSLVTIHVALRDVPDLITEENVFKTIIITAESLLKDFGIPSPKIAISALNPHAGEGGIFGNEEERISKAIDRAKEEIKRRGYELLIEGPFPPDTIYWRASRGEFDAVVSMYHDQGLIPLKLLHFSDAVNITLGLPIVRTSVDHGTAYDIAGKGIADEKSLRSAIRMAVMIAKNRKPCM